MASNHYINYFNSMDSNAPRYKAFFQMIWNTTGNESKELDSIIMREIAQNVSVIQKLDQSTIQSVEEIVSFSTTIGMHIYASICDVANKSIQPKHRIDVTRLFDYLNDTDEKYVELLCRYDVMPMISTHSRLTFDRLVQVQPHIVNYTYKEIAEVQNFIMNAIERGYILTLACFEKM